MTRIAVAVFDGAEELDFAGPWEVLAAWATQHPDDGVSVFTVADSTDLVLCAKGLKVVPDHTWDTAPAPDVLIVPGGYGVNAKLEDGVRQLGERSDDNGTTWTVEFELRYQPAN